MHLIEVLNGRVPLGGKRSPRWRDIQRNHIILNPECNACGTRIKLQVHHIKPFHTHPELELEPSNLWTLCNRRWRRCHFIFGHFYNWRRINPNVVRDTNNWNKKHANSNKRL